MRAISLERLKRLWPTRLPPGELLLVLTIFAAGLVVSGLIYRTTGEAVEAGAREHFERDVNWLEDEISRRLNESAAGLRAMRAAIEAKGAFDRTEFRKYIEARNISEEFPAVRGFGYLERVKREDLEDFLQAMRTGGAPDLTLRTGGNAKDLLIVRQVEPAARNLGVSGLDVGADAALRQVIDNAKARTWSR